MSKEKMINNQNETLNVNGVGFIKLAAFSIGATLASGVFYMPGNVAAGGGLQGGTYGLAIILGWVICGIGLFSMVMTYYSMSASKPHLKSGLYAYSKDGFGNYIGFNVAWGYWASAPVAQVSFSIALFTALGEFFPIFGTGNTLAAFIGATFVNWLCAYLVSRGMKEAMGLNFAIVIAKIVPIVTMLVIFIFSMHFDLSLFVQNFMGDEGSASLFEQIKSMMLFTVWVFIGFEAAIVASGRGINVKAASKGTLISLICILIIYILVSIFPLGVLPQEELVRLGNDGILSTGTILSEIIGPFGMTFIAIAVVISVGGAMLNYTMLCAEACYVPATDGTFPKFFAKTNKHDAPISAIIVTVALVQIFLFISFLWGAGYTAMLSLTTSLIMYPYFISVLYGLKMTLKGENIWAEESKAKKVLFIAITFIGSLYSLWLLYASGLSYALIAALLFAPGIIFYAIARKEQNRPVFNNKFEIVVFVFLIIAFAASLYLIISGTIAVF